MDKRKTVWMLLLLCLILFMKPVKVNAQQPALWFMDDLNFTQLPGGDFSHIDTLNFDVVGINNKNIKAPFDCEIVAIFSGYDNGNTIIIQSVDRVRYANGTSDYMSMAFAHDNDISDCYLGKKIAQGEIFCQNGNYGNVTGVHSHVTCISGKYSDHPGWVKMNSTYNTWSFHNAIHPVDALFISKTTNIYDTKGLSFKYRNDYSPIGTPLDLGNAFDATLTNSSGKSICCRDDGILQMGTYTYAERSKYVWTFEKQSDGSYKVTSWSGKSMDCAGASTANGTAIQAYTWNGTDAQKYFIYDAGNGKIVLEPACARGSVIDQGGTDWRIHLWEYSANNANQMFSLQISAKAKLDSSFNAKIMIHNTDNKKTVLYEDSKGDVVHKNLSDLGDNDKWRYVWHFEKNSDGSYAITNMNDKKGLDCNNWGTSNGTNISTFNYYDSSAQKWNIYDVSGGRYVLEPQCSLGRVADIGGTNGSLHLWQYSNNNANQRFLLVSDESTEEEIEGTDTISISSPSYSVQLDYTIGGSKEDIIYESLDTSIIKVEAGSSFITAVSPGTAVLRVKSKSNPQKYKDVTCTVGALEFMNYGTINSSEARVLKFDAYTNNAEGDCYLHIKTSVMNNDGQEVKSEGDYPAENKGRNWIYCIVDKNDFDNENGEYTTTATLYDGNGDIIDECSTTYIFSDYKTPYHINVDLDEEFDVYEKADAQSVQPVTRFYSGIYENKNNNQAGEIESISDNTFKGTKAGRLYCAYLNYSTAERLMVIIDIEPKEIVHEHKYSFKEVTKPTCTEKGIKEYTCSCGDSYTEDIPATGHKLASTVIEPTDEDDGYTLHKCTNEGCDYEYKDNIVPHKTSEDVHQHKYVGKITKEPTCVEAGTMTYSCECGVSYTEGISAKGHSYEDQIIAPTPESRGYTLHTCSICNDSYKDTYTEYEDSSEVSTDIRLETEVENGKIYFSWNVPDKAATYGIVYALDEQELDFAEKNNGYEISGVKSNSDTMTYECTTTLYENQPGGVWFRVVMKNGDIVEHSNAVKITKWNSERPDDGTDDDPKDTPKDSPEGNPSADLIDKQPQNSGDAQTTDQGATHTSEKKLLSSVNITNGVGIYNGIKLYWKAVAGADGYEVEYSVNSNLSNSKIDYLDYSSSGVYRVRNLLGNKVYYYRVRARRGTEGAYDYSEWTSIQKLTTMEEVTTETPTTTYSVPKIKLKSVKNNKRKTVTVKWKWNVKADGYQISYAKKKSFSGAKKKNANAYKESMTIKKLTKGKTYYVRVRAYVENEYGGKIYGKWSNVKKVKIKK